MGGAEFKVIVSVEARMVAQAFFVKNYVQCQCLQNKSGCDRRLKDYKSMHVRVGKIYMYIKKKVVQGQSFMDSPYVRGSVVTF